MALDLRALIQRMLGNTVIEERSNEAEVERRLRLAFGSPGISSVGVVNLTYPITSPGFYAVEAYGAVGDGTTDDTAAIAAAIAAAGQARTVVFQAGKSYRITSTLTMTADDQIWVMHGAQIYVDGAFAGITLGTNTLRVRRGKIYGGLVQTLSGGVDWTAGGVGYRLLKANNCVLRDVSVRWLEKGIEITSPPPPNATETTQNWIYPQMIADCALPVYIYADDTGTVNENTFFGGEISYGGSTPSATGRYAITIAHHASSFGNVNGVKFFGTYLGDSKSSNHPNAVYLDGVGCAFHACHIEGFPIPMVTFAGDAITGLLPNMLWGGGANYLAPEVDLDSDGVGIAAPFIFSGQDGAGVAGGAQAASAYVWLAKVLGAATKVAYAVKNASDVLTYTVTGGGAVRSLTATGGIGYGTGAGGTVTQATDKSTGVTLNTVTGLITMNGAALASDTTVSFTLTNSTIAVTDSIIIQHNLVGTAGAYLVTAQAQTGGALISVRNVTAGSLSEAILLRFSVFKAVSA